MINAIAVKDRLKNQAKRKLWRKQLQKKNLKKTVLKKTKRVGNKENRDEF